MSEEELIDLVASSLASLHGGKAIVQVNGSHFMEAGKDSSGVYVSINDRKLFSRVVSLMPKSMLHLSFLEELSARLKSRSATFTLRDGEKAVVKVGLGVHSLLGNEKVKLLSLRRLIKGK